MKTQIDIISGFLGSGKTKLINHFLEENIQMKEKVVVIQCEDGETEIDQVIVKEQDVWLTRTKIENLLDPYHIYDLIKKHRPERLIIEYNGMAKLNDFLEVLQEKLLRKHLFIGEIINTIDITTFDLFTQNIGGTFIEQIGNSEVLILNNSECFPEADLQALEVKLKTMNSFAKIIYPSSESDLEETNVANKGREKFLNIFLIFFAVFIIVYLSISFLKNAQINWVEVFYSKVLVLNTVFLSILLQAFPFILFGVFVSSIIQVLIPSEVLVKLFPRNKGLGFLAALGAGIFFPVCDCAVIPVASRLVKKGVPLGIAVTFMLAAPILNPIVVASTLYAFPGQPIIALSRVVIGGIVALAVGLIIAFIKMDQDVLLDGSDAFYCDCESCLELEVNTGFLSKIRAVFSHTSAEFIIVGRFLIIGAFLSSLVQVFVPKEIVLTLSDKPVVALLIMMLSAFILSICSTSDAFIARTFVNQMSMGSVMGFLVLGPMIDIKNLLMLTSSFKKGFIVRLVLLIFAISFEILLVAMKLLF